MEKQKILIVDDSAMNRELLVSILETEYDVREAENGLKAVEILGDDETDLWFVLLDIMMPVMDGFAVLNHINKHCWNDRVVVVMISSDDSSDKINRAYSLGAFDYISRPFDPVIVRRRIANTLFLYSRQHDLEETIKEQFYDQQRNNDLMVSILSHIVEFRNGESGLHVQNVRTITELLLKRLNWVTHKYPLTVEQINLITLASSIHDIGKIAIPAEILNKPGKLTDEEFKIMKTHSEVGAKMLSELPAEQFNSSLVKAAYEICRWHHERYDGRGYPDGLEGDEIPISAQVVAMADVYDALTSERCYKKAFSHEEAISMILNGKCGAFNPILLQCLDDISDALKNIKEKGVSIQTTAGVNNDKADGKKNNLNESQTGYMKLLYVDTLTEVYNRRYYKEYIKNFSNIEAFALVNVRRLTKINDECGQDAGDLVLKKIAKMLLSLIRRNDFVIRYGGDKFLIIFDSMSRDAIKTRLDEIIKKCGELRIDEYPQIHMAVSVDGVYGAIKPEELFGLVDVRLDQFKNGKNMINITVLDECQEDD